MALFSEGDRVEIDGSVINPTPPSPWWGRTGIVIFVGLPMHQVQENTSERELPQMYTVELDGDAGDLECQEHWLKRL